MTKSEVKKVLDNRQANFQFVLKAVADYVMSPLMYAPTVNVIVKKAKEAKDNKKNLTSMDLFLFFYAELKELVKGTKYCTSTYAEQMILKSVWEHTQLQTRVVQQIRNNYALLPELESVEVVETEEKPKKKIKKEKETPEQRAERLKRQAERMRQAKAKKAVKTLEPKKEVPKVEPQKTEEPKKDDGLTAEQRKQVELLKNLKL